MKNLALLAAMNSRGGNNMNDNYGRNDMRRNEMGYGRGEMNYGRGEMRRSEMEETPYEDGYFRYPYRYAGDMEDNVMPMEDYRRNIGFGEAAYRPRKENGQFRRRNEMHGGGESGQMLQHGGAEGMKSKKKLTWDMAEEWVESMQNEDEAKPMGGKYDMEKAKAMARKIGVSTAGQRFVEFYAIVNAMYSDYHQVAMKHGVDNADFYADLAKAWLEDADAVQNKARVYYDCIVEKE